MSTFFSLPIDFIKCLCYFVCVDFSLRISDWFRAYTKWRRGYHAGTSCGVSARLMFMPALTVDEIRRRFELSKEFNEIFDAFQQALCQRLEDIELYRQLFWNHSLSPDELQLFGEKLAKEFSSISYDVYMWLASVFEVTYSRCDNYELALKYYRKAAAVKPFQPDPYLDAADCYEPDLNIPPVSALIAFLKEGVKTVPVPRTLYQRLSHLYEIAGNDEMSDFCRRKAEEGSHPPTETPPAQ